MSLIGCARCLTCNDTKRQNKNEITTCRPIAMNNSLPIGKNDFSPCIDEGSELLDCCNIWFSCFKQIYK